MTCKLCGTKLTHEEFIKYRFYCEKCKPEIDEARKEIKEKK